MKNVEKTVLDIHGIKQTLALLAQSPNGATKIAVSLYRCGSIFYKEEGHKIYVDYLIGQDWQVAQHKDFNSLMESLKMISFVLVDIDLLRKEVELRKIQNKKIRATLPLQMLEQQVTSQIEKVDLRREHEKCQKTHDYWLGHAEAYEIVKHMIRSLNFAA